MPITTAYPREILYHHGKLDFHRPYSLPSKLSPAYFKNEEYLPGEHLITQVWDHPKVLQQMLHRHFTGQYTQHCSTPAAFQMCVHSGQQRTSQMFANSTYGTVMHFTSYSDYTDENGITNIHYRMSNNNDLKTAWIYWRLHPINVTKMGSIIRIPGCHIHRRGESWANISTKKDLRRPQCTEV